MTYCLGYVYGQVMLKRRNVQDYGNGWHAKCRVWKIIWLQRHDGLWDLTEDFLTVLITRHPP